MYDNPTPPHNNDPLNEYRFAFHGVAGDYFKIWLVNVLLSLITLGVFSAWAKVRSKRYFYDNTTLNGFRFDYHARPMSILVSRLVVIAFVFSGAILVAWGGTPPVGDNVLGSAIYITLLCFLLPWALVRSFSFNARYSSYRGVRFHFHKAYAKIYWIFAPALIFILAVNFVLVFTTGQLTEIFSPDGAKKHFLIGVFFLLFFLVLPAGVRAFYRIKMAHHAWGNAPFGCDAPPLVELVAPLMSVFLMIGAGYGVEALLVGWREENAPYLLGLITFFLLATVCLSPLFLVAELFRLYWRSVRVGGGAIQCDFSAAAYCYNILFVNLVATTLSLGLLHPWAKVRKARFLANNIRLLVPAAAMDSVVKRQEDKEDALGEELDSVEGFDFDVGLI